MRKKDILGNFSKNPNMVFTHTIRKIVGKNNEYSALIEFLPGCKDMFVEDAFGRQIQWAGSDFKILMYLPICENWCLSAYYSPKGELLFWYFDISRKNFVDEQGMPCIDDVFLDLVILPGGQTITLDEDELQEALDKGEISKEDFDNAYAVHEQIKNSKWRDVDFLNELSMRLLFGHKFSDIPEFNIFAKFEPIAKGLSNDKKYRVTANDGRNMLLRLTDIKEFDRKKAEYEKMERVYELGVITPKPYSFGLCNDGKTVYSLSEWLNGEDIESVLPRLSEAERYNFGIKAGKVLRKIHTLPAPANAEPWDTRFRNKIQERVDLYNAHKLESKNGEKIIKYLKDKQEILKSRPQTFWHGDFSFGNQMLMYNSEIGVIDFNYWIFGHGDPWWEFVIIPWGEEPSAHYLTGMINGYFDNKPLLYFFELLAYYYACNALSALSFSHLGLEPVKPEDGRQHVEDVLRWFDNMKNPVPTWYLTSL